MDDGWCRIHVDGPASTDELRAAVAAAVGGTVDDYGVQAPGFDFPVDEHDDYSPDARRTFPGGFLHFQYAVEVLPERDEPPLTTVGGLLEALWARGWAAVAVCDYEDQLPHRGGYNDPSLPWPA
ncbi:hypothetical protein [Solirubrobacter soli]|uniref:hypothetical protein n=1 Tax=Solirubrobacter soli TaxID=363832 RepID=UPI0003FE8A20|nr:hypothetical protein [Solirubrobacter soli]